MKFSTIASTLLLVASATDARLFGKHRRKKIADAAIGGSSSQDKDREVINAIPMKKPEAEDRPLRAAKDKKWEVKKTFQEAVDQKIQRNTNQVRVTLTNANMDRLSSAEAIFFGDTFLAAFKEVQVQYNDDDVHLRSMIVMSKSSPHDQHDRNLKFRTPTWALRLLPLLHSNGRM